MSDEDRDIDVESDDDDDLSTAGQYMTQAEKRAHHNALERKRRDHIKESFTNLRDSIPSLEGEKCSAPKRTSHKEEAAGRSAEKEQRGVGGIPMGGEVGQRSAKLDQGIEDTAARHREKSVREQHGRGGRRRGQPREAGVAAEEDGVNNATNNGHNASRAQILKQATEYITFMGKKNGSISQDIDDLKRQNSILDQQVRAMERAKRAGTFADQLNVDVENNSGNDKEDTDTDNSDTELEPHARKKMRT